MNGVLQGDPIGYRSRKNQVRRAREADEDQWSSFRRQHGGGEGLGDKTWAKMLTSDLAKRLGAVNPRAQVSADQFRRRGQYE